MHIYIYITDLLSIFYITGSALTDNRTLKTLLLSTNGIGAVACLTICVGVLENQNLEVSDEEREIDR